MWRVAFPLEGAWGARGLGRVTCANVRRFELEGIFVYHVYRINAVYPNRPRTRNRPRTAARVPVPWYAVHIVG